MTTRKAQPMHQQPRYGMRKLSVGLASCVLGFILYASPTVVQAAEADTVDPVVASEADHLTEAEGSAESDSLETQSSTNGSNEDLTSSEVSESELETEKYTKADSVVEEPNTQSEHASKEEASTEKTHDTTNGEVLSTEEISTTGADGTSLDPVAESGLNTADAEKEEPGKFIVEKIFEYIDAEGNKYSPFSPSFSYTETKQTESHKFSFIWSYHETLPKDYITGQAGYDDTTPGDFKLVNDPYIEYEGVKYYARDTERRFDFIPGKTFKVTYLYQKLITPGFFNVYHKFEEIDDDGNVVSSEKIKVKSEKTIPGFSIKPDFPRYKTQISHRFPNYLRIFELARIEKSENVDFYSTEFNPTWYLVKPRYGETQEVTLVFQTKVLKGNLFEKHVYKTIGLDNSVKEEVVVENYQEGHRFQTYTTEKKERDGYKFDRVDVPKHIRDDVVYNQDGSPATGKFIETLSLELTYIYYKYLPGKFEERHIYQVVDEDKNVIKEDIISHSSEGSPTDTYKTQKNNTKEDEGYVFKKVEAKPFKIKDSDNHIYVKYPEYNTDGSLAEGNYRPEEEFRVDYIYQKKVKVKGSLHETHIYQEVDEDGNVLSQEIESKETIGKEKTNYVAHPILKEGYRVVKVEAGDSAVAEAQGNELHGQYIAGLTQNVTFTYQKVVPTVGYMKEIHIYQEVDADGNVLSESYYTHVFSGKSDMIYVNSRIDKEGYELVDVRGSNGVKYSLVGDMGIDRYVGGRYQEVTYIYQKVKAADSQSAKPLLPASPDKSESEVVEKSPKVVEETSVEVQKAQLVPTLPQTGEADTKTLVGLSALSVMTGLGMLVSGRKKKED